MLHKLAGSLRIALYDWYLCHRTDENIFLFFAQQNGGCSPNKSGTLQTKSVTASQLATDSPAKVNGHSSQGEAWMKALAPK